MAFDRVLIITYLFPPSGGVGVSRFVSYARYLPLHNCQPFILTARNPATPTFDYDLAKKVPPDTEIFRAFNPGISYGTRDRLWKSILDGTSGDQTASRHKSQPASWKALAKRAIERIFCPDVQIIWIPFAMRSARRIVERHKITTVLINLPPYSCLKIAGSIKHDFPHIKLILDFRDEWIENYLTQFDSARTDFKLRLAVELEQKAVESADFVTAVTRSQLAQIRRRYLGQPDAKFLYVPNGFDPTVYEKFGPRPPANGKLVITYFGTVYANPNYRPLLNYLDAVDELPEQLRTRIETRIIGRVTREGAPFLSGRRHDIRQFGFMSREAALPYLQETSYNLIVSANLTTHGGKLFEYLAMPKPILALCPPEGELAQVICQTRTGRCVNNDDLSGIRELLLSMFDSSGSPITPEFHPDREAIREYEWPNLVARLARLTGIGAGN